MLMNKEILVKHSSAFPVNPDSTPIFLSRGHQQALDGLVQGLRRGYRLQFLSGSPGTGKSAVLVHFRKQMTTLQTVYLNHSFMGSIDDYIDKICREFGLSEPQGDDITDDDLFSELRSQLIDAGNPLLIVDNAEGIDSTSLEMLDTLSLKLSVPIILSGDCDFEQLANDSDTEPTSRRNRTLHLGTMSREETGQYIQHRLNEFDIENDIFSTDAVDAIHNYSDGNPRLINLICNNCIILMGLKDKAGVDTQMVHETARNKQASGIYPFAAAPADNTSRPHASRPRPARLHRTRPHNHTPGPEARTGPRHEPDLSRPGVSEPYISESFDSEPHIVTQPRRPGRTRMLPSLRAGVILLAGVSAGIFLYGTDMSKYRNEIDNLLRSAQQLYSSGRTAVQAAVHSDIRGQITAPPVDSREDTAIRPDPDVTHHDGPAYTDGPAEPGQSTVAAEDQLKQMVEKIRSKEERLDQLEARVAALTEKLDTGLARQASTRPQPGEQVRREENELDQLEAHIAALTEKLDAELARQASSRQQAPRQSAEASEREPDAAGDTESRAQTGDEADPRTLSPAQKKRLLRNYLERATYEIDRGQIQRAHRSIARGLEIDPYNRALQELRRQAYLAE